MQIGFWRGNLREGYSLEDIDIGGRIILNWIFRKWEGGMVLVDLAQDRDRWMVFVNVVMNLRGCIKCREFLIS